MNIEPGGLLGLLGVLGGGTGMWAWLSARSAAQAKQPSEKITAEAGYLDAVNRIGEGYAKATDHLMNHMQGELNGLRSEVRRLSLAEQACRNETAQQAQRIISLENVLRRQGIAIPIPRPVAETFALLEEGRTTLYQDGEAEDGGSI